MKNPVKIGLTGGIGSGKSLALKLISRKGIPVLQTDFIGHDLLKKIKIKKTLLKFFGKKILDKNGGVDRKKLAAEVFGDLSKKKRLNELLHPAVRKEVSGWIKRQNKKTCPILVVEVPLLFERGYNRSFDKVLSVSAPGPLRRKRLVARGWSLGEMKRREAAQWTQLQKNKKADWVIFNRGTPKDLKYAVDRWLQKVVKETGMRDGGALTTGGLKGKH